MAYIFLRYVWMSVHHSTSASLISGELCAHYWEENDGLWEVWCLCPATQKKWTLLEGDSPVANCRWETVNGTQYSYMCVCWRGFFFCFGENCVAYEPGYSSRYSDSLRARFRSSSPGRVKNFLFSTSSRPALGSNQPPIQWVPGALSPGVKRQVREADHSPPASAEVKKMWMYTSTPPYAFMA
jgi:hypothetical protein